jgi:hypothetical protein
MKKKVIYILRQSLIGIVALQLLNCSFDSQAYADNEDIYDYSYAYNTNYDPTESVVEWIIELNCGQQSRFSYDDHNDTSKNTSKTFHWQTDLQLPQAPRFFPYVTQERIPEEPMMKISSPCQEIISPPPDRMSA